MSEDFNGRLVVTVELECFDADPQLLETNLRELLSERVDSFMSVGNYSITVEKYTS